MTYTELKEYMMDFHLGYITKIELTAMFALYQLQNFGEVMS